MWAVRCLHEAQLYDDNCFLTLTYSPENIPDDGSLDKSHFQLFLKRLRKKISPRRISYFMCGEYGDNLERPHYHSLLFNFNFADRKFYKLSNSGDRLYTSETLDSIWGLGHCFIGDVTFESAAYCARYALKKITGDIAESHYKGRLPEYCAMSTKPAIGLNWINKYIDQTYRHDSVIINGVRQLPPRYYDKILRRTDRDRYEQIKKERDLFTKNKERTITRESFYAQLKSRTKRRLKDRETVTSQRVNLYKRNL